MTKKQTAKIEAKLQSVNSKSAYTSAEETVMKMSEQELNQAFEEINNN